MPHDEHDPHPDNVPGRFHVNRACIFCSVCTDVAPEVFAMAPAQDHAVVVRQPEGQMSLVRAWEALDGCPVEAIVDGDEAGRPRR